MSTKNIKKQLGTIEECEFNGGVAEQEVQRASQEIGLPFPPQYRAFLREFGAGYASSEEFIGLGGHRHLNVAWVTNELRNRKSATRFPPKMIPLRADGYGNYDCIDTTKPTADGEFQVVEWLHDGGNEQECRLLAESYFGWLLKMLSDIRRLDADGLG